MPASTHSHADHLDGSSESATAWLASAWPFVREHLPAAPAQVVEIGCGPLGGFVPAMRGAGYGAIGIDPEAPDGPDYRRTEFEQHDLKERVDAIVACTSLHHVADLDDVLDRVAAALAPTGVVVVVEWAHERFDEATARWCFERLPPAQDDGGWLHGHRDRWAASGQSWDDYFQDWVRDEHLHPGRDIVRALQARFATTLLVEAPYFFAELDNLTPDQEQQAIDAEQIQSAGIRYVGRAGAPDQA